jgi:signal transduction histidine kinase
MKIQSYKPKTVRGIVLTSVILSELIYGLFHFTFNIGDWYIGFGLTFLIPLIVSYFIGGWIVRLNTELSKTKVELENTNSKLALQNANNLKILALVAHDVRAPLVSAQGAISLLQSVNLDDEESRIISLLSSNFENTVDSVDNLLKWAHENLNEITLNPQHYNLNELVEKAISANENLLQQKNINLEKEINGNANILVDKNSFSIIFRNLISNAVKFSYPNNSIKISTNSQGLLKITDYGVGMAPETAQKLFSESVEAKSTSGTADEKGFGIGLKLVKSHLDLNEASIEVNSKPFKGTTFTLSFKM